MKEPSRLEDLWLTAKGIGLYYHLLRQSQFWTPDALARYQVRGLKKLFITAYEKTDYYRDLFWQADFDPYKNFSSLHDVSRIPLLSKDVARRESARLAAPEALQNSMELRTSGTTGQVFREFVSKDHWVMEQGIVWRHWSWLGYRFRDRMAIVRSYVPKEGEPLWKLDAARNFLFFSAYHINPETAATYIKKMQEFKPVVLRGYSSSLYILAKMAEQLRLELPPLKGILTGSETVLPHHRETIERVFQAKIFDWYGQAECTVTMNECEEHRGLHINSEYGYCELLPDAALAPNERRIVATCLRNAAMPLIRYDTGDVAIVDERTSVCSCGRGLPLVKAIRGRSDEFLYGCDGRVIHSVNLYTVMYKIDEVVAFQIIQSDRKSLEVRLETRSFPEATKERLVQDIRERFGQNMSVQVLVNEPFLQSADGKKRVIISRVKHEF